MSRGRRRDRDGANGFDEWGGYFEAKKAKLQQQYTETALNEVEKLSDIFNGVSILVNGLTHPNANELKKLMAQHGGFFQLYQNSSTTHIIASNLPNVKISKLGPVPIVKPSWITDSIALGKLLDYRRYLLYTNQSSTQPKLDFPVIPKNDQPDSGKVTKTASDPKFLEEFYNNSRLHLIATLGAEFKQLISELRDQSNGNFPGLNQLVEIPRDNLWTPTTQIIMHIDMDCFFVSVGLRNRPELRGQPIAVTHARNPQITNKEREAVVTMNLDRLPQTGELDLIDSKSSFSEIASCSYEARRCGVKNGMFLGVAIKLCPNLKTIPYDFEDYREVSHILYKTVASYTLDIEAVSCDEMYVDVTKTLQKTKMTVEEWSDHIRNEIMSKTGCPCSTGFGANRLQARLATKKAKPSGSYYLKPEDVESYLFEIPLADLPGVGRATLHKLHSLGLNTCGDVQVASLTVLQKELGQKLGETLLDQARGIDKKPLNYYHERKSVSAEVNYGIRFQTLEECLNFLESLSDEVWNRLNEIKMKSRCVTLKLMVRAPEAPLETAKFLGHGLCDSFSKSTTTNIPFVDPKMIFKEVKTLYEKLKVDFKELRGIGIQLTKLEKVAPINPTLNKFLQQKSKEKSMNSGVVDKTPIKEETSKVIAKNKTPVKEEKGRGGAKGVKTAAGNITTINKFFKSTKEKVSMSQEKIKSIDLEVFKALPEDIRKEVIEEYNIDVATLYKPPPQPSPSPVETPKKSHFDGLSWEKIKPILYQWMKSVDVPSDYDVQMLGEFFRRLAIDRKIEMLKVALNFLHRNFSQLDCQWHRAYFAIVDLTQQGMVARYGNTLLVNRNFSCCCF